MAKTSDLEAEKIKNNLNCVLIGSEVLVFDEVHSTNDLAKRYLEQNVQDGLVLIADSQTQGRGRLGRAWHSAPGVGLYLSVVLKPRLETEHLPQLTLLAGLATVIAVNSFAGQKARLKWPNDILLNGKKLAGVLCEYCLPAQGDPAVILGIGVNVNHAAQSFPEDLRAIATSLRIETGNRFDRQALLLAILRNLDHEYETYLLGGEQSVLKKWSDHTDMFGKKIRITKGPAVIHGTALGLDSWGKLRVRTETGEEVGCDSGEVSLEMSR